MHLDVSVGSLGEVTDRGGRVLGAHEHGTVCADPAGNEFCAFVRTEPLPAYRRDLLGRGATHLWDVPGCSRPVPWTVRSRIPRATSSASFEAMPNSDHPDPA